MFKISFKETSTPCKIVVKEGKKTSVTYRGVIRLPKLWWYMPPEIRRWINHCSYVDISENIAANTATIYATGISRCREDDKYDTLLGERIAEARSKYNMYRFIATLCDKLIHYYRKLVYGDEAFIMWDSENSPSVKEKSEDLYSDSLKYNTLMNKELTHIEVLLNANRNGNK